MKWKLVLGLVFSAFFLWLAFRDARLKEVWQALLSARYWLMVPVVALTLLAYALRAWRWRYLLASVQEMRFAPLFASTMIGFMGNNVLPARLGELLRAHSLGRSTKVSRSAALASIVVERIFDIFVLLLLFGGILVFRGLPPEIRSWGLILLVAVTPVGIALVLYRSHSGPFLKLIDLLIPVRLRPRTREMALNFRQGLGIFGSFRPMLLALVFSVLMWLTLAAISVLCLVALHLRLPAEAGLVVLVVMAIGTMIPSAPGYIGTLQYAGTLALLPYGVDRSVALSFTLFYHASQWFPVTVIGLIYFLREHFSFKQLSRLEPVAAEDPARGKEGYLDA